MRQVFITHPQIRRLRYFPISLRICLFGSVLFLAAACASTEESLPSGIPPGPVRGFQIQIHTTQENVDAHEIAEQATVWLASLDEGLVRKLNGSTDIPVEIKWLQPYYRVRVGHYRTREEARGMMAKLAEEFPAAFIVPDTIE